MIDQPSLFDQEPVASPEVTLEPSLNNAPSPEDTVFKDPYREQNRRADEIVASRGEDLGAEQAPVVRVNVSTPEEVLTPHGVEDIVQEPPKPIGHDIYERLTPEEAAAGKRLLEKYRPRAGV